MPDETVDLSRNLPSVEIVADMECPSLMRTLPAVTLSATVWPAPPFTLDKTLPVITLSATALLAPILTLSKNLPAVTLIADMGLSLQSLLPSTELDAELMLGEILSLDPLVQTLPVIDIDAILYGGNAITANLILPSVQMEAILYHYNMSLIKTLPSVEMNATLTLGEILSLTKTLPALTLSSSVYLTEILSLTTNLPALVIEAKIGINTLCLVLNVNTGAISEWNFGFNSIVNKKGDIFMADGVKVYKLGGDDDNGTNIASYFQLGLSHAGITNLKEALGYYIGMRSDGSTQAKMISDDTVGELHTLPTTADKIKMRRIMTELGPHGTWLGMRFNNVSGSDFKVNLISLLAKVLDRREDA